MKYTEKADIAAKAVRVLDSVTMSRQKVAAKNYAQIARKNILKCKDEHVSRFWGGFIIKASPAIEQIDSALESMQKRLNKPRYTLKDGEWVRRVPRSAEFMATQAKGDAAARGLAEFGSAVAEPEHKDAQRLHNIQMSNLAGLANAYPSRIAGRASYSHSPAQAEWN